MNILNSINNENDIKNIDKKEYPLLAKEIRDLIIKSVSENGGHLASNLGLVELTMALHLCMQLPDDKIIWDVGHQSYTHKILTGRRDDLDGLRLYGGISGFPKTSESECDCFNTGHSTTSISAAIGFAAARDIRGSKEKVAAIIGDGSFTGGMAYEALNNLGQLKTGCVVIINDNDMSIDKNVGGMSHFLSKVRVGHAYNGFKTGVEDKLMNMQVVGPTVAKTLKKSKDTLKYMFAVTRFFEEFGITYVGPIDGHDIGLLVKTLKSAFELNRPIIIHIKTEKGRGYKYAVKHPGYFHSVSPFDIDTGKPKIKKSKYSNTDIFGKELVKMGSENNNLVVITAAMAKGTGVNYFQEAFPNRTFDVGIAEQHAVTFAAGLSASGMVPVVAIYSSFLQRAYDQILHDVCLQNLHVIFAIDRSGLVGQDGSTHQGIYDVSFLSHMPNMTIMSPKNKYELVDMMHFAVNHNGPIAIKYSRGDATSLFKECKKDIQLGKSETIYDGEEIAILSYGNMLEEADKLCQLLKEKDNIDASLINARFLKPLDVNMLNSLTEKHQTVVVMEENVFSGGLTSQVMAFYNKNNVNIKVVDGSIPKEMVEHGSIKILREKLGINANSIYNKIKGTL